MSRASYVGRSGSIRAAAIADETSLPFLYPRFRPNPRYQVKCKHKDPNSLHCAQPWHQVEASFLAAISLLYQTRDRHCKAELKSPLLQTQSIRAKEYFESNDNQKHLEKSDIDDGVFLFVESNKYGSALLRELRHRTSSSRGHDLFVKRSNFSRRITSADSGLPMKMWQAFMMQKGFQVKTRAYCSQAQSDGVRNGTDVFHQNKQERNGAGSGSAKLTSEGDAAGKTVTSSPGTENDSIWQPVQLSSTRHTTEDSSPNSPWSQDARSQQLTMLRNIRLLERELVRARQRLKASLDENEPMSLQRAAEQQSSLVSTTTPLRIPLTKEDYVNMVDLYYYTTQKETISSPMHSPNPILFKESPAEELSKRVDVRNKLNIDLESQIDIAIDPGFYAKIVADLQAFESRFREEALSSNSLLEPLVTALLKGTCSARELFKLYQRFPKPGVAYLPTSAVRLLLYRMSTYNDKRSEANMVRYLSLIDDMQVAKLPITISEWSSAIYLAGRAFWQVTEYDLGRSIDVWKRMEQQADITASNVTFNILFDIAVKAKKYVFADKVIREMLDRGLHLNRLGRVSFIWYQGWLGDGDAVRRAYRDFVDAGEIVDTLVLNCVMISLIRAQEPAAAEQIYERMKALSSDVQNYLLRKRQSDGVASQGNQPPSVVQYPPPGSGKIENEYASNHLGRILLNSSILATKEPSLHRKLQASMPMIPDETTYRILIDQYAVISGEIDRLSVILNDMTDIGISMNNLYFRLIFKGFYIHGGSKYSQWIPRLLDVVWQACLNGMKALKLRKSKVNDQSKHHEMANDDESKESDDNDKDEDEEAEGIEWTKNDGPRRESAEVLDERAVNTERAHMKEPVDRPDQDTSMGDIMDESDQPWRKFVDEFATYTPTPGLGTSRMSSSQKPAPSSSIFTSRIFSGNGNNSRSNTDDNAVDDSDAPPPNPSSPEGVDEVADFDSVYDGASVLSPPGSLHLQAMSDYQPSRHIQPSLALIKWVLRAHAKVTGRRETVEDVWWECKGVWRPKNEEEKERILGVLEVCLRNCDRRSGGGGGTY